MNEKNLRFAIIVTTVITALIHLALSFSPFNLLFFLNGAGYFGLLAAFLGYISFLRGKKQLVYWGYMAFVFVTIVLYFVFNDPADYNTFGYLTKLDEVVLLLALWFHRTK